MLNLEFVWILLRFKQTRNWAVSGQQIIQNDYNSVAS